MSAIKIIYLKEMREMLRDKRVRSSAFFGPLMMVAMLMMVFGFLISSLSEAKNQKAHVVRSNNSVVKRMEDSKMEVHFVSSVAEGREMLKDGRARVVLNFPDEIDQKLMAHEPATVEAYYNPNEQVSQVALAAIQQIFAKVNDESRKQLLASRGIPVEMANPVHLEPIKVTVGQAKANDILVGFLPYMIVIWAFYGGMSIVSDLVAGEKEKSTLETLLIAPIGRTQIAMGKFLSLGTICLLSSMSALAGVYVIGAAHLNVTKKLFEQGVGVTPEAAGVIFLVLVPTVALFASLMLAVSAYAKNVRESQSYLTLISFIVLMPAICSQFIGFTDAGSARWVSFVPILSTANIIRQAMFGKFEAASIIACMSVSVFIALIAMRVAIHLFSREQVLTRV